MSERLRPSDVVAAVLAGVGFLIILTVTILWGAWDLWRHLIRPLR